MIVSNNNVELEGYPTRAPRYIDKNGKPFLVLGFATQESYRDPGGEWKQYKPVFHDLLVFKPDLIEPHKNLTTKDRLKISGHLNYEFVKAKSFDGSDVTIKKATIIVQQIEPAPLPQKQEPSP